MKLMRVELVMNISLKHLYIGTLSTPSGGLDIGGLVPKTALKGPISMLRAPNHNPGTRGNRIHTWKPSMGSSWSPLGSSKSTP